MFLRLWQPEDRVPGGAARHVLRRHVLRNGLIPPVNLRGLDFSHAFGGFVLYVEVFFGLPGIGKLTADTLGGLDLPPIVGLAVFLAIVVVVTNALVGVVVAWLDPRLRAGSVAAIGRSAFRVYGRWETEPRSKGARGPTELHPRPTCVHHRSARGLGDPAAVPPDR